MTANELFQKHLKKYLGQYRGNLRWFCEAVDNGYLPAADDETIRPHVQLLKRHLGGTVVSDEEEFLLRFGLIVPGLIRGIRPPIAVLDSERGGFSDKRIGQAVGQVNRLREALRLGRRYLGSFKSNGVNTLQELAEVLKDAPHSDDAWITMHADLPNPEAAELAKRAFACWDELEGSRELCTDILTCLINFRYEGLGIQTVEALERDLFWPSSIYRDAPNDVANRIIKRIETAQGLRQLNHMLLALAWTRSEAARRAFQSWKYAPPTWASGLYVLPEKYLHNGGWTLGANNERRDLMSLSCHRMIPHTCATAGRFSVPCRIEIEKRCPACDGVLVWLFDFTNLPDEFFSEERAGAPKRVLCCLECACFCPAMFSRYQLDGTAELYGKIDSSGNGSFGGRPASVRELILNPQPPFSAAEPFGMDDATTLGGIPMWLQDAAFPHCPDCQNAMTFLAQFDNGSMVQPEEGIYYSFFCSDCRIAAVNYQQT